MKDLVLRQYLKGDMPPFQVNVFVRIIRENFQMSQFVEPILHPFPSWFPNHSFTQLSKVSLYYGETQFEYLSTGSKYSRKMNEREFGILDAQLFQVRHL